MDIVIAPAYQCYILCFALLLVCACNKHKLREGSTLLQVSVSISDDLQLYQKERQYTEGWLLSKASPKTLPMQRPGASTIPDTDGFWRKRLDAVRLARYTTLLVDLCLTIPSDSTKKHFFCSFRLYRQGGTLPFCRGAKSALHLKLSTVRIDMVEVVGGDFLSRLRYTNSSDSFDSVISRHKYRFKSQMSGVLDEAVTDPRAFRSSTSQGINGRH